MADPGVAARLAYLNLLGMIHGHSGDASHAGEVFERQRRLALASDEPVYGVLADMNQGALLLRLGAVEEAEGLTRRALEGNRSIGDRFGASSCSSTSRIRLSLLDGWVRLGLQQQMRWRQRTASDSQCSAPRRGSFWLRYSWPRGIFVRQPRPLRAALHLCDVLELSTLNSPACRIWLLPSWTRTTTDRPFAGRERRAALAYALESPEAMATQHRALGQALFENSRLAEAAEEFELAHELSLGCW